MSSAGTMTRPMQSSKGPTDLIMFIPRQHVLPCSPIGPHIPWCCNLGIMLTTLSKEVCLLSLHGRLVLFLGVFYWLNGGGCHALRFLGPYPPSFLQKSVTRRCNNTVM